jgi:hypothetical protein
MLRQVPSHEVIETTVVQRDLEYPTNIHLVEQALYNLYIPLFIYRAYQITHL